MPPVLLPDRPDSWGHSAPCYQQLSPFICQLRLELRGPRAGWRPRPLAIRELAGLGEGSLPPCVGEQAWARKPPAFMSLAGLFSGCWLPGRLSGGQS